VVPKKHVRDIYGLDAATGADVMAELIRTANAVKRGLQCDGVYITQANDPAAGQDVFHLHFHVYPR
jgi:histidine triad (HIT) family protein